MGLPAWMLQQTTAERLGDPSGGVGFAPVRRRGFLRRALGSFAGLVESMLANEATAKRPGLLQGVDARAKLVGLIGLVVVLTLVHRLPTLAVAYAFCLLLALVSRVPAARVTRVWLMVPLFSAAIVTPALLNVVTPGEPLVTLWRFSTTHLGPWPLPPTLAITDAGVLVASRFVLRTGVCVTLALLLAATTPTPHLLRGLRAVGVPAVFVMLLEMMERYLSVLVRAAEEIHLAKVSRSVTAGSIRQEQAWVAAGIGALFRRTQALGGQVYAAMVSRGYTGKVYLLDEPRWRLTDWGFLTTFVGFGAILALMG